MISVLMSVYSNDKCSDFIESIESIFLHQHLKPSEIVVVLDGPVDSEIKKYLNLCICEGWPIIIVPLEFNVGLGRALNIGLSYCKYEYIARMDSDDISVSCRLQKQLEYFEQNPHIDVLGGYIEEFNSISNRKRRRIVPLNSGSIKYRLNFLNSMNHVTVMFKKASLSKIGNYETRFFSFEDYATWLKGRSDLVFENLNIVLVNVRIDSEFIYRRSGWNYFKREYYFFTQYYKDSHINFMWYIFNVITRFILRLFPPIILAYFYRLLRKK